MEPGYQDKVTGYFVSFIYVLKNFKVKSKNKSVYFYLTYILVIVQLIIKSVNNTMILLRTASTLRYNKAESMQDG